MIAGSLLGILNIVTEGLLCLAYLAGIVVGILLIIRKVKLPGILTAVGFGLFGLNLVYGLLFNLVIMPQLITNIDLPYQVIYPVNNCLQGIISFLGIAAVVVAVITGIMPKKETEGI